jgi:predicted ATP-dependent serine protease
MKVSINGYLKIKVMEVKTERRGRPRKLKEDVISFDVRDIELKRGSELEFNDSLFIPMETETELDIILSTEGGIMPGTNMMLAGGPGSGKSTVVLDMLSKLTMKGLKVLFVSGEMDEISHYKYCKRIPQFECVQTLFLKNYSQNPKEALEHVFELGYDVIAIDSIAEVIEMFKDSYKTTMGAAEFWLLNLQDKHKKGGNSKGYYTTFINIQQMTKAGDFVGSNRLKHMVDAFCSVERSKDGLERSLHFSKNRDCDKDFKVFFSIYGGSVHYSYETVTD